MPEDSLIVISDIIKDPWYIEYLLPYLGTLLVAIIAFFLSQLYFRHLDKRRAREKYIGILRVIADEIKRNLDLECQLHAYLFVGANPTFGLSFFVSGRDFSELTSVCLNYDLLKQIFNKYFELRHIQNRVDRIIEISNELAQIKSTRPVDHDKEHDAERRLRSERGGTILLIGGNAKVSFNLYNDMVEEINSVSKKGKMTYLPDSYLEDKFNQFQESPDVTRAAEHSNIDLGKRPEFYR